jgi:hypothetical protein
MNKSRKVLLAVYSLALFVTTGVCNLPAQAGSMSMGTVPSAGAAPAPVPTVNPWAPSRVKVVYPITPYGTPNYYPGPHIRMVRANTAGAKREFFNGYICFHYENGKMVVDNNAPPALKKPTPGYITMNRIESGGVGNNYHMVGSTMVVDGQDYPTGSYGIRYVDYVDAITTQPVSPPSSGNNMVIPSM